MNKPVWVLPQLLLANLAFAATVADVDTAARKCSPSVPGSCDALVSLATTDPDWLVRLAAVTQLKDQAALAKLATQDADAHVRKAAVEGLSDRVVLNRLAATAKDPAVRKAADDRLKETVAGLTQAAGDLIKQTHDKNQAIARIKLALLEPPIKSRLPGLRCIVEESPMSQGIPCSARFPNVTPTGRR